MEMFALLTHPKNQKQASVSPSMSSVSPSASPKPPSDKPTPSSKPEKTPKIIHQTWKDHNIPENLVEYAESCKRVNPDYEYILHTDTDLRNIVKEYFPNYIKDYDNFSHFIERVDFARYAILWAFGGVYADLDMQCFNSFDPLVQRNKPVFGSEPIEHRERLYEGRKIVICNALMISPPRDPIWLEVMQFAVDNYKPGVDPVYNTGPMMLTQLYEKDPFVFSKSILLSSCAFYAQSDRLSFKTQLGVPHISRECNLDLRPPVAIHRWAHTWIEPRYNVPEGCKVALLAVGSLAAVVLVVCISLCISKLVKHS